MSTMEKTASVILLVCAVVITASIGLASVGSFMNNAMQAAALAQHVK